jgi:LPS sulfotransferase NodH
MPPDRTSELDLSGAAFDHPPSPLRKKIFICTSQRTGSYWLCRAMIHCGIGVPHEYFHRLHIPLIGPWCGLAALADAGRLTSDPDLRRAYMAAIVHRRTRNGIFSAKIQGAEYAAFLDNDEGMHLFQHGNFIFLRREDLLDQAISRHVAALTGQWGNDGAVTTPTADRPDFFDNDRIIRTANEIAREEVSWRLFFAQNGVRPRILSYEALSADIGGCLRRIAKEFALDLPSRDLDYAEPPPERAERGPSRAMIRQRFLEVNRRFVPAGKDAPGAR